VPGTVEAFVRAVENSVRRLKDAGFLVFGSQDWHPSNHISFAVNHPGRRPLDVITIDGRTQVLWPPHCVQGTENARVLVDNNLFLAIVRKGQNPAFDSYSAFQDDGGVKTEMDAVLKVNGVSHIVIFGLATDYCVRATTLDALTAGYGVVIVEEHCRGIAPDTTAAALREAVQRGAVVKGTVDEFLLGI
jgi:nicotinamidase/pyrazinamidase